MEYFGEIIYDDRMLHEDIPLVIFGAGKYGKRIHEFLTMNGRADRIECICDRNSGLWQTEYEGIAIVDPDEFVPQHLEHHYLVSGKYADEISEYLIRQGARNVHYLFLN